MRLIDADVTIKYLREFRCKDCDRRKGMKNGKIRFCYEIGDAPCRACDIGDTVEYFLDEDISPTVDAVPVVQCKDCIKRGKPCECPIDRAISQGLLNDENYTENWFCADGERREDK